MSRRQRWDIHVHTTFSPDGGSTVAQYAAALDAGLADGIGFTDHDEFFPGTDARLDPGPYFAEIRRWQDQGYAFKIGAEIDWMPAHEAEIREHLAAWPFDYVIGSVHNLPSSSISSRDVSAFDTPETLDRMLGEYLDQLTSGLKTGLFDVMGHPGVFARHFAPGFLESLGRVRAVQDFEDELARRVAASDCALEVNTSGLFYARKEPCAGAFLLERFRFHGGRRITLASDSHQVDHLRRGFSEAAERFVRIGFREVALPWQPDLPVPLEEYL